MEDSVCALLLLHARSLGLLQKPNELAELKAVLTTQERYGSRWLLAYEANIKQWLPSGTNGDYVASDHNFSLLKSAQVSFYDAKKTVLSSVDEADEESDSYLDRYMTDYYSPKEDDMDHEADEIDDSEDC